MEIFSSQTNVILLVGFFITISMHLLIFYVMQKKTDRLNHSTQEHLQQNFSQLFDQLEKQMEIEAKILENVQKIGGHCRKESKHQAEVRELLHDVRSEIIDQALSKLKLDKVIKNVIG